MSTLSNTSQDATTLSPTTVPPTFVLGHHSSGTSILVRLLREFFGISFGTESQFINHYYKRLDDYGDLQQDENLTRLVTHIRQERWFQRNHKKFGYDPSVEDILNRITERSYRGVLAAVFQTLADHNGFTRWGDKSPSDSFNLGVFRELFPEARYVHIIRDGRDVALSLFGRPFGRKNTYLAASDWKTLVSCVDEFRQSIPAENSLEITYEQMLSEPVETFQLLRQFLDVEDPDGRIEQRLETELPEILKRTNFNKWKKSFSAAQVRCYERIAGDLLAKHGYEVTHASEPHALNSVSTAMWTVHNRLMMYTFKDYWKDNWYKAKLRSRNLLRRVTG